ncbi:MAG TPA: DUF805 domain-containing protein [Pseudolabrys sp.]|jgi:uncharacterized membrane protein YhaH (DUF805 family)|nr:DUF805 domain-containing protein [Pseudolabrys sp.]
MSADIGALLFGFQGRINRAKYWLATAIYTVIVAALIGAGFLFHFGGLFLAVFVIACVVLFISGIAIGIKRLHDRDKSGWWLLVFYLVPGVFDGMDRVLGPNLLFNLVSIAISVWMIVELGFLRGTSGPNQYGPDPLAV